MNFKLKGTFSLVLVAALLLAMASPVYASPVVTGTNGNTIYLSFTPVDEEYNPIDSVSAGDPLYYAVNFSGNPTDPEDPTFADD